MNVNAIKSMKGLKKCLDEGKAREYLFFWGHTPRDRTVVGKECLSQCYPSASRVGETVYPTAEHYMMAEKARLFNDESICERILVSTDPGAVKKLGRKIKGYNEGLWQSEWFEIVCRANEAKFSQNLDLNVFLSKTKDKVLVEASPHDKIWGIGMDSGHKNISEPYKWQGINLLGFALMQAKLRIEAGGK